MLLSIVVWLAAGVALWRLWAWATADGGPVAMVVSLGFLIRAAGGCALFWISWLELPVASASQLGNGFWFFAPDAELYLAAAVSVLEGGLRDVLAITATYPSHGFVQLVAFSVAALGDTAALALLLNGAAYLGTCALVIRLVPPARRRDRRTLLSVGVLACGPALVLWSLQLLKDTVFIFLAALAVSGFRWWQDEWHRGGRGWSGAAAAAGLLCLALYALASLRWYFALILWGVSLPFGALVAWQSARRTLAMAATAALALLLAQAVRLGAQDNLPPQIARAMQVPSWTQSAGVPAALGTYVEQAKMGLETRPGETAIHPGRRMRFCGGMASTAAETSTGGACEWTQLFATRSLALVVPPSLARRAELVEMGGGRGLWLFADVDTVMFDIVLLIAGVASVRAVRRRAQWRSPVFLLLVAMAVLLAAPLVYTMGNYGTLFRLRGMLYFLAAVMPLAIDDGVDAAVRVDP